MAPNIASLPQTETTSTRQSPNGAILATSFLCSCMSGLLVSLVWRGYHKWKVLALEATWAEKRESERKGRIRAEISLRTATKALESRSEGNEDRGDSSMILNAIGHIVSPYTKRMGTPRQGALVPSSRAFVQMTIPMQTVEGLDSYSHLWIIFEFHANTDLASSKKTKIRPPRGGGIKVGQLATRSPHRPNALGLSLVKMDRLDAPNKRVHVSAIDLVNGTPVYDLKPFVPWDLPGHFGEESVALRNVASYPKWVVEDDALQKVVFTDEAERSLERVVALGYLKPLYTNGNDGIPAAKTTICQVLAQDPRAAIKRGTVSKRSEPSYKILFGKTQVDFRVLSDGVEVIQLQKMEFDESVFVDGIPVVGY